MFEGRDSSDPSWWAPVPRGMSARQQRVFSRMIPHRVLIASLRGEALRRGNEWREYTARVRAEMRGGSDAAS